MLIFWFFGLNFPILSKKLSKIWFFEVKILIVGLSGQKIVEILVFQAQNLQFLGVQVKIIQVLGKRLSKF